jgi:uncharacterized protein (TIGR02594 family)
MHYVTHALKDLGLREIKGPKNAPRITKLLAELGAWWGDDETPWCGVMVAGWFAECGLPYPKHYYRALAWADYGVMCPDPMYGAVAVLSRVGGGHVGLVTAMSADGRFVRLLGGNQGNAVSQAWFDTQKRPVIYRMPADVMMAKAPVLNVGNLSTSEA